MWRPRKPWAYASEPCGPARAEPGTGTRNELIFDRETYRYLGERRVVTAAAAGGAPVGTVLTSSALLKVSIADGPPALS
ncbi:hypothetical protein Aple_068720 [Acrocarpospora pleiomorpha]|uniref:Uncharacterized protein n=1 Tax=Acrocarpospora pleiomorpha TaxID=90975 RepID=A0A5M3XX50_9ACTN|nr:hypothetical protein [Acrocarpospora pleiomorpha]GES23973.1 hypothetical protein Aple_068720 [Acrocarpospora pleiomorpha]